MERRFPIRRRKHRFNYYIWGNAPKAVMPLKLLPKHVWKNAIGASKKAKRLHLVPDAEGFFSCPVVSCDSNIYRSQRGCRKHVCQRHGWYFYFDSRPNVEVVLPEQCTKAKTMERTKRSNTKDIPTFLKTCPIFKTFKGWLTSPAGGLKTNVQADQVSCRMMKYLKFCCQDQDEEWDVPVQVADYCLGSISLISDFIDYLQTSWSVGYAGLIGYINSLSHFLDFRRISTNLNGNVSVFIAAEIYMDRVKKCLSKKMRSEWNVLLSVEYLSKINCWATLEDLEAVIPYHGNKFSQILINSSVDGATIPSHDLSFCTSYIVAVLFLMVKASRPMTYQYLTVTMIKSIGEDGIIDQTIFKTQTKYGFDSLIFSKETIDIINGYINCIRKRLNPQCDYLLISRNGTQLSRLSDIFGRLVYQAIGKYINPTRYRQIIETESAQNLSIDDQNAISQDQKHTSLVARVHYKKLQSRAFAEKAKQSMDKLRNNSNSVETIEKINESAAISTRKGDLNTDFTISHKEKESKGAIDKEKKPTNNRQKKIAFSEIEDSFLREGIKKYGGKWKSILHDPDFKFHSSRQPATLCTRARSQNFIT